MNKKTQVVVEQTNTQKAFSKAQFAMQCITVIFQLAFVAFIVMIFVNMGTIIRLIKEGNDLMSKVNEGDVKGMMKNTGITLTNVAMLSGNATQTIGLVDTMLFTANKLTKNMTPEDIDQLMANMNILLLEASTINMTDVVDVVKAVLINARSISGRVAQNHEFTLKF